jgi:hypothetical protein
MHTTQVKPLHLHTAEDLPKDLKKAMFPYEGKARRADNSLTWFALL